MNNTRNYAYAVIAVAAGAVAGLGPACAQETGKVMIDVADCIKLDAPEARLACYESRVAAVFGQRAAQAAAARTAPPPPAVTEPVQQSQSSSARPRRREEKAQAAESTAADDIVSRVNALREVVPNAWQITLENGQVWRQTVSKHYELRQGQQVRIYGTHWGNASRLSSDEINGYIQVERVR
jgi:hypothetical protein